MLGEIPRISIPQSLRVGLHEIDATTDALGFPGLQSAQTQIGVQAADDALEEFLIRLPCGGEEPLAVAAEGSDQPIIRNDRTQGARVHVGAGDVAGAPGLPGNITGGFDPRLDFGKARDAVAQDQETLRQVVVEIGAGGLKTSELPQPHAGLRPVCLGAFRTGIVGHQAEVHIIGSRPDGVIDHHTVLQGVSEFQGLPIGAQADQLGPVRDDRVLHPIRVGGSGPAIGLQVVYLDGFARQVISLDVEPMRRLKSQRQRVRLAHGQSRP